MPPRTDKHSTWRSRLFTIIYHAHTPAGKWFDILLIISILFSVSVIMLDSVSEIKRAYDPVLNRFEWFFTFLFTIEYLLRITCNPRPVRYIFSFYGIVDLLSIVPTYLSFFISGANYMVVVRVLRILRIFRILKLSEYISQINILTTALAGSRQKIIVFLFFVCTSVVIFGSIMYLIEGPGNGFTSIPRSIYWAIVTLTTVGYGDISPQTNIGQATASLVMITGYAIIAVPTGIFTAELSQAINQGDTVRKCPGCQKTGHEPMARYCNSCGSKL